jgi:hypothetical protein
MALVALNISPWILHARSQVGSRDAVASMAKSNRPALGPRTTGVDRTLSRKAATAALAGLLGTFAIALRPVLQR